MIMNKSNEYSERYNSYVEIAAMSVIGDRDRQEDCFGYNISDDSLLLCVCDGMGGYNGGSEASRLVVDTILKQYQTIESIEEPTKVLCIFTKAANEVVNQLHKTNMKISNAGSTLVMIYIKERKLYWNSVGDSRLYIWRKKEFIQTTKDQNYHTVLKEKRTAGEISEEEFYQGSQKGDALFNYLGIGNLNLIDYNTEPLILKERDKLVICTDGLYRILSHNEVSGILNQEKDIKTTLQMIEFAVRKKSKENNQRRDNMTVAVIKIK